MSIPDFIETEGSLKRVNLVKEAILSGNPLLLEGETGTSKTRTAIVASLQINQEPIVLNFSSQTTIEDLLGRITKDADSYGFFSFINGPYTDAFMNGKCLILDEINLAYENVLQCIQASLDSGMLYLETSENEKKVVHKHQNFHLIATQNPLSDRFSQKRQFLSQKFRSLFQTITFNEIKEDELQEIAEGLAKDLIISDKEEIISKLIKFHFYWKEKATIENQIHVFTIREISRTINSMKQGLSPYESISINYGSRYDKNVLEEMQRTLIKFGFIPTKTDFNNIPQFDGNLFFMTEPIKRAFYSSFHLLKTCHPILITGPDGCGKTSFARWISQIYHSSSELTNEKQKVTSDDEDLEKTKQKEEEEDHKDAPEVEEQKKTEKVTNFFICNPEVSISDIIGRYMPVKGADGEAPITWIDGPVVESVKNGNCLIMDQIDTAPSTIIERLNSLHDNLGVKDAKFQIQENSEENIINIHPNFRIIATSTLDGMKDISPALLNRFTIIYIDDQLEELLKNNKLDEFIRKIAPQFVQSNDINLISKSIFNNGNSMTVSKISMIVKGFSSLKKVFPRALSSHILDFCLYATSNNREIPNMDENFIKLLLSSLNEYKKDTKYDKFIYNKADATKKLMAVLVAAFVAGFHVVLIGKTGLGKTSAAIAMSELSKFSQGNQLITFNGQTQLEELFGYFTIEKGIFTSHFGPLSDAMKTGKIFIADELNLADQMIIQSLNVAIEPLRNEEIILPVIGQRINIDEHFFFIGCQNDISMYGRKQLPEAFKKKMLCINYPENSYLDLLSLTNSLAEEFELKNCAFGTTELIKLMKEDPIFKKKVWSLREVRKLFRRTKYTSENHNDMKGFTIYSNAAFLLRSSFRDYPDISKKTTELISKAFQLREQDRKNLLKDLEADVFVSRDQEKSHFFLKKNSLLIKVVNSELLLIPKELQTFWQAFFEVMITHPSEPLLFVGPSGFKTFLAKKICPLSPVVYLHSDTTIPNLIGQIGLLDKNQARQYLLASLYKLAGSAPSDEFRALFKEIEKLEIIDKEKIDKVKDFIENPEFINIAENIIQQLIDIDYPQNEVISASSNYLSVFKLGVVTEHILKQNSLILKNIAQPSPTVLERLNDLFSVSPTLTLFEDTSNTFTPNTNKLLSKFLSKFRIIGICTTREKHGLSEAMLSRLTEIFIPSYTTNDQELVINSVVQSQINDNKWIDFYKDKLSKANEIFNKEKEKLKITIPFSKIIEIVRYSISLKNFFTEHDRKEAEESLFSLSLLRFATEQLSFSRKKQFINAFYNEDSKFSLYEGLKNLYSEESIEETAPKDFLLLEEDQGIRSKLSNIFMPTHVNKLPETVIYFTSALKDLADTIISCSAINYPLIIEGPSGSGKSSVFFYLSKCIDANVVRISISSSTTAEELFGKYEPNTSSEFLRFDYQPTNFLNAISFNTFNSANQPVSDDFSPLKKQWIIIEDLHLASTSVLDLLAPVFNNQIEQLLLSDGTVVPKRDYFIVGLVSQPLQSQSIIRSSMVYKVPDYTKSEYEYIYKKILNRNHFKDEICNYFIDKMFLLSQLSASSQYKIPVTVREVYKFINLYEGSEGKIEINQIVRMLCLGRYVNNEFFENAKQELEFQDDNEKLPNIEVNVTTSTLSSNEIPMHINASRTRRQYDIQYLSSSEKELFVFLSMALKKYTPIVIQGPTSSGKTYSVQLFSDIVGKPLQIIQLNSEINSQTIAGTFQPSKNLSDFELEELKEAILSISDLPNLTPEFENKIKNEDINDWHPSDFKNLRSILTSTRDSLNLSEKERANAFIRKVDNLLQFYNHLARNESVIVKAMLEGSWLLLDGIENAPSDFFDRLSSLFDDKPSLNLYERGNGYIYSYDSSNPERRIHPDFRIIMTYNPVDVNYANIFSSSLLSKCIIYSMKSIDNNVNDSSLIIFGLINQIELKDMDESSVLSIKLGKIHIAAKEFTFNSQFSVTGRSIIHLCRNIEYINTYENIDFEKMKSIINSIYGSLMNNPLEFMNAVNEKFTEKVDIDMLDNIKKAQQITSKAYVEIMNLINNFMTEIKDNIQVRFDFESFLGWLLQMHLKDMEMVYNAMSYKLINFLTQLIKKVLNDSDITDSITDFVSHCSSIRCLQILTIQIRQACQDNNIENTFAKNASLSSPQVNEIPQFQIIVKKIRCILYLIQKKIFTMRSLPVLFSDSSRKIYLDICEKWRNDESSDSLYIKFEQDSFVNLFIKEKDKDAFDIHYNLEPSCNDTFLKFCVSYILFNDKKCRFIFAGINLDLYCFLETLLNDNSDIEMFINAIDFVGSFYRFFYIYINEECTLDEFVSQCKNGLSDNPEQLQNDFQTLRAIIAKSTFLNDPSISDAFNIIKPIINAIKDLYQQYNDKYSNLYLKKHENQEVAKEFYKLIDSINNRLEKEKDLKLPLELFVKVAYNIEINEEHYDFLKQIYQSIEPQKDKKVNKFTWPHGREIKFSNETPSFQLLDSLINYSNKEQIDFQSANWMTLCSIKENTEYFLKEFLNKSISQELIEKYRTNNKSQLLYELSQIKDNKYCSRNEIITFFNNLSDRSLAVNQVFIDLAHHYELNMDKNFIINIPNFEFNDIVALIINPIDKSPGPLFNDVVIDDDDYDFIQSQNKDFEIVNNIEKDFFLRLTKEYLKGKVPNIENLSFKAIVEYVTSKSSIETHIQNMVQVIFNAYKISQVALSKKKSIELTFEDIPSKFNEDFINKNPVVGFYLSLHQEVSPTIEQIKHLCNNSSFPLSVFIFRQYTNENIIEIKLPTTFSASLSQDVENFIIQIATVIKENINKGKITKFVNLLGFLLDNIPVILNSHHTEHFREIILDLISKVQKPIISKYIIKYLHKEIEKMILILGSDKWDQLLTSNCINPTEPLLMFLMNPWEKVFHSIVVDFDNSKKQYEFKIRKILDDIKNQFEYKYNDAFYNRIKDAKCQDERNLCIKINEEYIRTNLNKKENSKLTGNPEMQKALHNYCQYLNKALNQIKVFPDVYKGKFQSQDYYYDFHQFLIDNEGFNRPTFDKMMVLIVIIPKVKNTNINLTYYNKNQLTKISGIISKIAIFKLPEDTSIEQLNLQSKDANIIFVNVSTDSTAGFCPKFKYNEMKEYFNQYQKLFSQLIEDNEEIKTGSVEVIFNIHTYDNFIEKIKEVKNEISDSISIAGSLNQLSKLTEKTLSKINEMKDYFPAKFENNTEIPKETISCLEPFLEFVNKFLIQLKEIEIPKEIIDADEEFVINKSSSFQKILNTVQRFAKNPKPSINGETTLYDEKEFQIACKNPEKLIIPTLFFNGNDVYLNINQISVKLGPFYKGTPYSDLKFRIINLTKQEIKCIFHQDKEVIIDLQYENVDGFFYLVFPISQIEFDYNTDSEIRFTGTISFYSIDLEKPFKEIKYDVSLFFLSPNVYLKLENQSFAIKNGEAQILPYYALANSNINISAVPYFKQLKMYELSDNTARKPRITGSGIVNNDIKVILPFKYFDEDHLSIQFDFGLTAESPVPIPLKVDISDAYFDVMIFDDDYKEFSRYNSNVTISNLWRDVYILISYCNFSDTRISPSISFEKMNSESFEIRLNEPVFFEPYSQDVKIISFRARTFGKPQKERINNTLKVQIGAKAPKEIQFYFCFDYIYPNNYYNTISTNYYLKNCSFWDGKEFKDYINGRIYDFLETNYIISTVSFYFYQKNNSQLLTLKYNDFGELTNVYNRNDNEFEILYIENDPKSIQIQIGPTKHFNQVNNRLVLFSRIKGKNDMIFPLFGYCKSATEKFDISKIAQTNDNLILFVEWYMNFLTSTEKNYPGFILQNYKFVPTNNTFCSNNINYLFSYLAFHYNNLPYDSIIKAIKEFTNNNIIEEKYNTVVNKETSNEWKFISLVCAIIDTMNIVYEDLRIRSFIVNFPIPLEAIKNEHIRLIEKSKIDFNSMHKKEAYNNQLGKLNEVSKINDNYKSKYINDGYKISKYVKWTFENKFQIISEEEFPKENVNNITTKDEVQTDFSDESGDIELSNVSFKNVNNLLGIYKAFDSILRNTYQFTISIHSSLIQKKGLKHNIEIFNELVSFFMWAKDIKDHSPYSTYLDRFIDAYQSMIMRLKSSGITIRSNHYLSQKNQNNDFVVKPKYNISIETFTWLQPGKKKKETILNKQKPKIENQLPNPITNPTPTPPIPKLRKNIDKSKGSYLSEGKRKGTTIYGIGLDKTIDIVQYSEDLVEVPNKDYIDYIFESMINPEKENQEIELFKDDKSHIPIHYDAIIKNKSMEKIDYFFYGAEALSSSILNQLDDKSPIFNKIDKCYASILIDCSNTFSNIQKASLVLISIAYANALTALRIPYSLIIFCDDNFQYILKKLDEKHDKIHFIRLIESMIINRRMSSMSLAIQMAKMKVIPKDINSKRTNHIIYTLTDGLSTSINFTNEWRSKILNDQNVSVSFFFLNILSSEKSQLLINMWSKFVIRISKAKSPTTVFYSTYENILNNNEFYHVLAKQNKNDAEVTKMVSLSECFANPIIQSIIQPNKKISHIISVKTLAKRKESIDLNDDLFQPIINILCDNSLNDTKYFKDVSDDKSIDDPFEVDIPLMKIDPFSVNISSNDTSDIRQNYTTFCNDLFELSSNLVDQSNVQELSSYIFKPNKPSQYTPSSNGTLFYFPGLIRFLLTQGQDTKIFLEKKAGLTKSYSIFVVIDCSTSCINIQSSIHAFQSIFILLESLSKIDIPVFNLIVTTQKGPQILSLEKSTFEALSIYSPIWISLFTCLLNPHENCFLKHALLSALAIRTQEKTLESVLFLFTDGNFSDHNQKEYNTLLENISSYNVKTVTIGIGSYSSKISSLSTKKVWSPNPKNIIKSILSLFGKESNDFTSKIQSLYQTIEERKIESQQIGLKLAKFFEFESLNDYTFKDLITELNKVTRNISVFNDFYNIRSKGNEVFSEESTYDLGKKHFYKGISILICQFWDYTMSSDEDKGVSKEVLINGVGNNNKSVINALKEFDIEAVIVQNYKDAIFKMKSGKFSEVWVICGRYDGNMPDSTKHSNLLSQFIDCLIIYWQNGGGIVFWTDNSPLVAEVNFFLSKAKFETKKVNKDDEYKYDLVKFRIGGNYGGGKMLHKSENPQKSSFNPNIKIQCEGYEKYLYSANMSEIYEGYTISSAIIPPLDAPDQCYNETEKYKFPSVEDLYPFHEFSISSNGGFSSLYYNSPLESPRGDIVIDCGFSKLFYELTKEGIYYYVRNIAIFMLSLEKKSSMLKGKADPNKSKPKQFDFDIKEYVVVDPKFYQYNDEHAVDIVFLIDGTGSMKYLIEAVINVCDELMMKIKSNSKNNDFRFGAVVYRDEAVGNLYYEATRNIKHPVYLSNKPNHSDLNSKIEKLKEFFQNIRPFGGGDDGPEDWVSGFKKLKDLNWRKYSEKMVIHIADASAHGESYNLKKFNLPRFTSDESYNKKLYNDMDHKQNLELDELIKWSANYNIRFSCICAGKRETTENSFRRAESIYRKNNGIDYTIIKLREYDGNNSITNEQKQMILNTVKEVALNSIDKCVAVDKRISIPKVKTWAPIVPKNPKPNPQEPTNEKIVVLPPKPKPIVPFADILSDQEKSSKKQPPPAKPVSSAPIKSNPWAVLEKFNKNPENPLSSTSRVNQNNNHETDSTENHENKEKEEEEEEEERISDANDDDNNSERYTNDQNYNDDDEDNDINQNDSDQSFDENDFDFDDDE